MMVIKRLIDPETLGARVSEPDMAKFNYNFDYADWLSDRDNIALENNGDIALFTYEYPGVYSGHYLMRSRGKAAYDQSVNMLTEMFSKHAEVIRGLTPVINLPALAMTRRLGFKDYGTVETPAGDCVVFIMTKKEFEDRT